MDYSVGSHVRVKLYGGKVIEAKITAIVNLSAGRKIRIRERAPTLSDPKINFGATEPHVKELDKARAEWRRRHP
jgi:hypothetical protein